MSEQQYPEGTKFYEVSITRTMNIAVIVAIEPDDDGDIEDIEEVAGRMFDQLELDSFTEVDWDTKNIPITEQKYNQKKQEGMEFYDPNE